MLARALLHAWTLVFSGCMKNVPAASGRRSLGTSQNLHSGSWLAVDAVLPAANVAQPQQVTIVLCKNSSNVIVNHSLRM